MPGSQNKWADTLSRLCPNLMELAVDYTLRVMDAPGFIVQADDVKKRKILSGDDSLKKLNST